MITYQAQRGFTLTEILITVVVIGILAIIAVPIYNSYIKKAQSSACLLEVKGYSNQILYIINDPENSFSVTSPIVGACLSITDATGWTLSTQQKIVAVAKAPSNAFIECDIPNGSPCKILP